MKIFAQLSRIMTPLRLMAACIGKGRAKSIVVWVCLWSIDVSLAISTWRLYQAWRDYSALTANNPYYHNNQPKMPEGLVWSLLVFLVILVLPVVWFYRDRHKEDIAAGTA
jgi:hypothetical protein